MADSEPRCNCVPAIGPLSAELMAGWREAMAMGRAQLERGARNAALFHFQRALAQAESLFGRWHNHDDATAALVVSHHGVADVLSRAGQLDDAARRLCHIHLLLQQVAGDGGLQPGLCAAAARHSRQTWAELAHFDSQHPGDARIRACLAAKPVESPTRSTTTLH